MNKIKIILVTYLVLVLPVIVTGHYYYTYKYNLYFKLPFVDENDTVMPIDITVKIEANKIDSSVEDFIKTNREGGYADYAEFFDRLLNTDENIADIYFSAEIYTDDNGEYKQNIKETRQSWSERTNRRLEYILPGEKEQYFVLSAYSNGKKIWRVYRFVADKNRILYAPYGKQSGLDSLLHLWVGAISGGVTGLEPIRYADYLFGMFNYNSDVTFDNEYGFSLRLNSFNFSEDGTNGVSSEIKEIFNMFLSSLRAKSIADVSKYVSEHSMGNISHLFDAAYQSDYDRFLGDMNSASPAYYIKADPFVIAYSSVSYSQALQPMFVVKRDGKYSLTEIGRLSSSVDMFRDQNILTSLSNHEY